MRVALDQIKIAKVAMFLFHALVYWGTVWVLELIDPHGGFPFFSQYFIV